MNILFVCKYNVYRSQMAELLLKSINKKDTIKSAGLISGGSNSLRSKMFRQFGIDKINIKSLTVPMLKEIDILVIVADDVPKIIFEDKRLGSYKIIDWHIQDVGDDEEDIRKTNEKINKNVIKLNNYLEKLRAEIDISD